MSFLPIARLVPRACATERVGVDEVVALDEERLEYHTMHERVFDVWTLSDGTRSVDAIAAAVFGSDDAARRDLTGQALLELMDAGLVVDDAEARAWFVSRRAVAKVAAGMVLGAVGLPLVKSITAPDAASADSPPVLPTPVYWLEDGGTCHVDDVVSVCKSGCCCNSDVSRPMGVCRPVADCGYKCN